MVSFIVIGKNEGWKISKCIESILRAAKQSSLKNYEIIYVDSKSNDDSIERVKEFYTVKIFLITGQANAAIARNIGAMEAKGDSLFFIDGDMEIMGSFLASVMNDKFELIYQCATGHLNDVFYDSKGEFLSTMPRTYKVNIPLEFQEIKVNGGIFIIKKEIWNKINGMKGKYKFDQDFDLAIRLRKSGVSIVRVPVLVANHHTIDYRNENRMWDLLRSGSDTYPGLLLREHLFDTSLLLTMFRSHYTSFLLLFSLICLFCNIELFKLTVLIYFIIFFLKVFLNTINVITKANKLKYFFERLILQFIRDFHLWISFFFFYPQNITSYEYVAIRH